ncbi:hypothetical protein IWQ60_003995 [Tieghemiomyces parasiticus]|uniref:Ketoreductase domain-containing protein n=1 Tax=Tieghemiomyces parasiticus TaxID=78921 RepID=A0A9W8AF55_9FUNG|nr:hypothetical protein IWQ60_003995 [Tieghemiomyces parasiticus]
MAVTLDDLVHLVKVSLLHYSTAAVAVILCLYRGYAFLSPLPLCFTAATLALGYWEARARRLLRRRQAFRWSEEIVLVTGGSGGLGQQLVRTLAVRNATVASLDISPPTDGLGSNVTHYTCDLTDPAAVERTYRQVVAELGAPTVLINNAGIVRPRLVAEESLDDLLITFQVNFFAAVQLTKLALPDMLKAGRGHLVNVSSVLGYTAACRVAAYTSSKAALSNYTDALRQEVHTKYGAGDIIHVTLVAPGQLATPLFEKAELGTFLTPILVPHELSKAILDAVASETDQQVKLPFYTTLLPFMSALPIPVKQFLHRFSAADTAMDGFAKTVDNI